MYELFRDKPTRILGQALYPDIYYIRRTYRTLIDYVKSYYRRNPKAVESTNIIANLIQHFYIDFELDDNAFVAAVERQGIGIARNFGLTFNMNRGKVFEKGITLGPHCTELAIASFEKFNYGKEITNWLELQPVKYLYHTRTDINLPVMNNTTPGKGHGVIVINIPMLLVQYRHWLRWQANRGVEQPENVYRFLGSIVLPNMLESYLDIAYFNRLARDLQGIRNPKFPVAHPFYLTDLTDRVDRMIKHVNKEALAKGIEIEGLAWITPTLYKDNLFQVMQLPREPLSYQNEWTYTLARFPYVKYLVQALHRNPGYDKSQINHVMIELINATTDKIFVTMGSSRFIKDFNQEVQDLIKLMRTM